MKRWLFIMFILTFVCDRVHAYTEDEDIQTFIIQINSAWTNRIYPEILSNINNRLSIDGNDVLANCIKANYYLWCENIPTQAHQAALNVLVAVSNSPRSELIELANNIMDTILDVPATEASAYNQVHTDHLHSIFPDTFPGMIECISLADPFFNSRDIQIESQYPSGGVPVSPSDWDVNTKLAGTTSFSRVYLKGMEVSFSAPQVYSNYTFVQWLKDGTEYSTNSTVSFTVDSNETWTVVYTNSP